MAGEIPESVDDQVDALPAFVEPMLARLEKRPFDSDEHLFEIKWDGIRALTFIEHGAHRMLSRRRNDMTERYPELAFLAELGSGTLLDGELVVLRDGRPDFRAVMSREKARDPIKIENLVRTHPASYVVFDVLYLGGYPVMNRPLSARRELLRGLVEGAASPRLVLSDGVVGQGVHTFAQMREMGLEGMVAKRLDSSYSPGVRSDAWIKVKTTQQMHCVILGYAVDDAGELKSLIVGTDDDAVLRCVGKVGSGLSDAERRRLQERLDAHLRDTPLVETAETVGAGVWVEPRLFCLVSYHERTPDGNLRAPVYEGLVEEA